MHAAPYQTSDWQHPAEQTRNEMDSDKVMNLVTQLNYVSDELEEDLGRGGIKGKSVCRFALLLRCPCHVSSVWLWSVRLPPGPGVRTPGSCVFSWLEPACSQEVSLQSLVQSGFRRLGRLLGGNARGRCPISANLRRNSLRFARGPLQSRSLPISRLKGSDRVQ